MNGGHYKSIVRYRTYRREPGGYEWEWDDTRDPPVGDI